MSERFPGRNYPEHLKGKQPCVAFKPESDDPFLASYYGPPPHWCPLCNGGGVRMFCFNCNRDHHAGGWETCTPEEEVGDQ